MANKKTTLKTQTGDNVYPNVLKENLPSAMIFTEMKGQHVQKMKLASGAREVRPLVKLGA